MSIADDKDRHTPFAADEATPTPEQEHAEAPASDTSEIAMRLSVLGKLVIPPTVHQ